MEKNEAQLPDFSVMNDRDLWEWDGACPTPEDDWTTWDTKAVIAQGEELKKRAQALGLPYKEFVQKVRFSC